MAAGLQPEAILEELDRLWSSHGKGSEGVLRACAMTLIAVTPEAEDPAETVAEIMRENPSRAIILRLGDESRPPEARVVAQCWMPFGTREQICCEQVEITAGKPDLAALRPFLLALIAPDLPVVLWRRAALPAAPEFAGLAGKTVIDSSAWPDPSPVFAELSSALRRGERVADLSWARITRWRETVAQLFENCNCLSNLRQFREIEIEHGGDRVPPAALYLAAWLTRALNSPEVRFRPAASWDAAGVHGLRIAGPDFEAVVRRTEELVIEIAAGNLKSRAVLPRPTESALLREELGIAGPDPVFESVLPEAIALARR